jgi:hypothetical protein
MTTLTPQPAAVLRSAVILVLIVLLGPEARLLMAAQGEAPKPSEKPFVAEYYYTARWGHADEFIHLFKKNHLPVLQKEIERGRILRVTAVKPRYHATEDGRWDYRVTIVFKDVAAAHDNSGEEAIKKELFPDQETYRREEQRRFEILQAHWDVPIEDVDLDQGPSGERDR